MGYMRDMIMILAGGLVGAIFGEIVQEKFPLEIGVILAMFWASFLLGIGGLYEKFGRKLLFPK